MENEFVGLKFDCPAPPAACAFRTGDQVLSYVQIGGADGYTPLWENAVIMLCYMSGAQMLAYLLLSFNTRESARAGG